MRQRRREEGSEMRRCGGTPKSVTGRHIRNTEVCGKIVSMREEKGSFSSPSPTSSSASPSPPLSQKA